MARTFSEDLPQLLTDCNDAMVDLRHDLHAHPELSFEEHRTTKVVRERLVELGWELAPCPTPTGAVAVLRGTTPGKRIMIRADIDGLPVTEESSLPYTSRNPGIMHACGHDVHTAALLGVADVLARRREELAGEYTLVFQPAEEGLGGAHAMIEGGLLEAHPVDFVIGAHVTSLAPVGLVATRAGIMMSEATSLSVQIKGKGGHGAMASSDGNVVLAVSHLAPRLSEVVTGLSYEGTDCACSAGVIHAGTANNVVPRHALLRGTLRTFTSDQLREALTRLERILREVEEEYGVTCQLERGEGTPAVNNDPDVAKRVLTSARSLMGDHNVWELPPTSPSDDVSQFLNRVPGCYMFVGGAMPDGSSGMHHSPDFSVDDGALGAAAGVLSKSAVDLAQL
ncbi:MAG: amidohydrolase [Acidobacteria bacterium]|nr:amidohydrolase [Acidobacteriota bacterium]